MNQPTSMAAQVMTAAGVETHAEDYNHQTREHWKVVYDSSVNGGGRGREEGVEAVSPILRTADELEQIETVCDSLTDAGFEVNHTCGLHVHIDGKQDCDLATVKNVAKIYALFEPGFDMFMSPLRRANKAGYARSIALPGDSDWFSQAYIEDKFRKLDRVNSVERITTVFGERNGKVNFGHLRDGDYGTVEFRQHQASLNAKKVTNWVRLLQALWVAGQTVDPEVRYYKTEELVPSLLDAINPPAEVRAYYENVVSLLSPPEEAHDIY